MRHDIEGRSPTVVHEAATNKPTADSLSTESPQGDRLEAI
jgi:hypothetical protein